MQPPPTLEQTLMRFVEERVAASTAVAAASTRPRPRGRRYTIDILPALDIEIALPPLPERPRSAESPEPHTSPYARRRASLTRE